MLYLGESFNTLDQSKRLIIPMRFRDGFGNELIMYKSGEPCLYLYDTARFGEIVERIRSLPDDGLMEERVRFFYACVTQISIDRTGRIVVPQDFLDHAGIQSDVALLGHENRVEIWDAVLYKDRKAAAESDPAMMKLPVKL